MLRPILRLMLLAALITLVSALSARMIGAGSERSTLQWDYETLTGTITTVIVDGSYRHEVLSKSLHFTSDGGFGWVEENGMLRRWNGASLERIPLSDSPMTDLTWAANGHLAWITRSAPHAAPDLYVWDGQRTFLLGSSDHELSSLVWSNDGRLAWASIHDSDARANLYVWDGNAPILIDTPINPVNSLTWAADGRLAWTAIGVGEASDIFVWDGESVRNISQSVDSDVLPVWSHDGRMIWQTYSHATWFSMSLWDGAVVHNNFGGHVFVGSEPTWSANGWLAYAAVLPEFGGTKIIVWDGESVRNLTPSTFRNMSPRWSPDGRLAWVEDDHISIWDGANIVTVPFAVEPYRYTPIPRFFWSPPQTM